MKTNGTAIIFFDFGLNDIHLLLSQNFIKRRSTSPAIPVPVIPGTTNIPRSTILETEDTVSI